MPHIPRVVCSGCLVEMRQAKTGVCVEMLTKEGEPYYKVEGDAFACPRCSRTVITGFAPEPLAHAFQADYERHFALYKVTLI